MDNRENEQSILYSFTDVLGDEIMDSQPISLTPTIEVHQQIYEESNMVTETKRPSKYTGQHGEFRSVEEIDQKYRSVFSYPYFNLVQSKIIDEALYTDKSLVVCAPTGSGKTVVFEMAIVQLLMELEDKKYSGDFKIIYMAPVKAICNERLSEWYPKFTKLGLLCIEVTGDTDVDFSQLTPYRIIITTPEKWDILTRRWTDYRGLVGVIKLFLIDEVHILNDQARGPVLEAVVSRMKTIESSSQSAYRIEQLQKRLKGEQVDSEGPPRIRFVAVSATVSNPEDVATWLGHADNPAVYHKFGDETRPVKLKRVVEGYPCPEGTSIFKFDIILNYKLWPIIQKYYDGKPTLIFCNTRKSVQLTAETLAKEVTIMFDDEQKAKLNALASSIKNKKIQFLIANGVGCHHAGLLYEERCNIELAFKRKDLPILITTTTLAMGVNLPAHLVIIKNTMQYVNGSYQEYGISTVMQMVGRAGRPQYDHCATAVIMTRAQYKARYQALVGGSEPLQSYLHKRLTENLNSEAALHTVMDVAQCVQWLCSTFLYVRAAKDPKRYLGLPPMAAPQLISKKIEELCVKAMNGLASAGLITMDEASCIESTDAGRMMSVHYLDFETMKRIMKIEGTETLEQILWVVCESHELADMHLRVDERRFLNTLNRNNAAATIRFPMKGKISTRQMKLNCVIQAILGCLPIPDPSLNQESMKIMRIADRVCRCVVSYLTRSDLISKQPSYYSAILNSIILSKCIIANLWENSPYVSKQLKGIGPTFSNLLATSGKVNFILLEESHPRDLERIMNRSPPAGNVMRKQISLLPKYQISMTPVDEQTVTIKLVLLNLNYLLENMNSLTAGPAHKSYVIVGDSENSLLLLTSFKDNDFMSIYNGTLTYHITRKFRFEHKLFAHCISSTIAGIDVQSEYFFKSLDPLDKSQVQETPKRKLVKKQTNITDTFKERKKRTNTCDIEVSKEKKRRDNALLEKFKYLKESFTMASRELQQDLDKSTKLSDIIHHEIATNDRPVAQNTIDDDLAAFENGMDFDFEENNEIPDNVSVEEINDSTENERIDSILNDIEVEISKQEKPTCDQFKIIHKDIGKVPDTTYSRPKMLPKISSYKELRQHFAKPLKKTDNFSFMSRLEKNIDASQEDPVSSIKETGFSDSIKNHIRKYLDETKKLKTNINSSLTKELLEIADNADYAKPSLIQPVVKGISEKANMIENNGKIEDLEPRNIGHSVPKTKLNEDINEITSDTIGNMKMSEVSEIDLVNQQHENNEHDQTVDIIDIVDVSVDSDTETTKDLLDEFYSNRKDENVVDLKDNQYQRTDEEINTTKNYNSAYFLNIDTLMNDNLDEIPEIKLKNKVVDDFRINSFDLAAPVQVQSQTKINSSSILPDRVSPQNNQWLVPVISKYYDNAGISSVELEKTNYLHNTIIDLEPINKENMQINTTEDGKRNSLEPIACNPPTLTKCEEETKTHEEKKKEIGNNNSQTYTKHQNSFQHNAEAQIIKKHSYKKTEVDVWEKAQTTVKVIKTVSLDVTELISYSNNGNDTEEVNEKHDVNYEHNVIPQQEIKNTGNATCQIHKNKVESTTENDKALDTKKCDEFEKHDVQSILKKYSQRLKKFSEPILTNQTQSQPDTLQTKTKSRKPFRICDIHTIDTPPMVNIIEFSKVSAEKVEENSQFEITSEQNKIPNETEDCLVNSPKELETKDCDHFDIEQSMLDPKMLLQCYTKPADDVIPPPPEFSDYSPIAKEINCSDSNNFHEDNYYSEIFDGGDEIEITPSKEIETWTLQTDEEINADVNLNSRSFTIVNDVTRNIYDNARPAYLDQFSGRAKKLNHFKMSSKCKLKIRRN